MRLIVIFFFTLLFCFNGTSQHVVEIDCDTMRYEYAAYADSIGYYEDLFAGTHEAKVSDNRLRLAYFVALRHYPELKQAKVKLKLKPISSTMQAQPRWDFIFQKRSARSYAVFVNSNASITGISYQDLSFNSLVGWIGHEMAHVLDYSKKNNGQLFAFISSYVFDKNELRRTERKADKVTIKHGLGMQLLEGVNFFHRSKKVKKAYREKKKKYYLTPEEIIADIEDQCHDKKH